MPKVSFPSELAFNQPENSKQTDIWVTITTSDPTKPDRVGVPFVIRFPELAKYGVRYLQAFETAFALINFYPPERMVGKQSRTRWEKHALLSGQ